MPLADARHRRAVLSYAKLSAIGLGQLVSHLILQSSQVTAHLYLGGDR